MQIVISFCNETVYEFTINNDKETLNVEVAFQLASCELQLAFRINYLSLSPGKGKSSWIRTV